MADLALDLAIDVARIDVARLTRDVHYHAHFLFEMHHLAQ